MTVRTDRARQTVGLDLRVRSVHAVLSTRPEPRAAACSTESHVLRTNRTTRTPGIRGRGCVTAICSAYPRFVERGEARVRSVGNGRFVTFLIHKLVLTPPLSTPGTLNRRTRGPGTPEQRGANRLKPTCLVPPGPAPARPVHLGCAVVPSRLPIPPRSDSDRIRNLHSGFRGLKVPSK
jgi:hypothetical protein